MRTALMLTKAEWLCHSARRKRFAPQIVEVPGTVPTGTVSSELLFTFLNCLVLSDIYREGIRAFHFFAGRDRDVLVRD